MTAEITTVFFDDSQTDNVRDEPFILQLLMDVILVCDPD